MHGDATRGVQCHVGGAAAPADGAHGWGLGFYAIGAGESRGAACTASGVGVVPALTDLRHGMTRCHQPQEHFLQRGSRNTELTDEVRAVLQLAEEHWHVLAAVLRQANRQVGCFRSHQLRARKEVGHKSLQGAQFVRLSQQLHLVPGTETVFQEQGSAERTQLAVGKNGHLHNHHVG